MDVSGIVRDRIGEINRSVAQRLAAIPTPPQQFSQLLGDRLKQDADGIAYISATPDNIALMRSVQTTKRAAQAEGMSASLAQKREQYDPLVKQASAKYGLPEELIHGVIRAESSYNPNAVSSAGAQGLMQLMPATASGLGVSNSFDAAQNIDGGAKYLRQMLDRFDGDLRLALAAYNCGPYKVESLGIASSGDASAYTRLSEGVRSYVSRVLGYSGLATA